MTIKAIIFDLDDTLHPKNQLRDSAIRQCIDAMIKKGLNCTLEQGSRKMREITESNPRKDIFKETANFFGCYNKEIWEYGHNLYNNAEFTELKPFPESKEILTQLRNKNLKLFLVTQGSIKQQEKKVKVLELEQYFNKIFLCTDGEKEKCFSDIINLGFKPEEILNVGDNISNEIKVGNKLGMKSIRILKGKYSILQPQSTLEKPNFTINNLLEIPDIINQINSKKPTLSQESTNQIVSSIPNNPIQGKVSGTKHLKIVTIGGGTGTSPLLEGLKKYTDNLTAIVTVTDTGRSTGKLRKDLNMLAPGDIRNCLIALSNNEELMYDLFQYRFDTGELEGYSFGNLLIAALTKITGSFEQAIEKASKILELKGNVTPATFDNVNICAILEDQTILNEEDKIIDRHNSKVFLRSPILKVFHSPTARPNQKAINAIKEADLIIFSPGSLFTSIISNLLVEGIPEAVNQSNAKKIYICNIMSQQCQTYGYKASDHLKQIMNYLKGKIDYIILNTQKPNQDILEAYKKENAHLIENDISTIEQLDIKAIQEGVLDKTAEKKLLWEKKDLLRHDPDKVAEVIMELIG